MCHQRVMATVIVSLWNLASMAAAWADNSLASTFPVQRGAKPV